MKVLLINPPKTRIFGTGFISSVVDLGLPLGTLQIASWLEKHNNKVSVIDCAGDPKAFVQRLEGTKIRYGIASQDLANRIKDFNPDIVGISGQFIAQMDDVVWVSKIVKKVKGVPVVAGGSVIYPEISDMLEKEESIDICAYGEGELTMLELVDYAEGKKKLKDIDGIFYKDSKGKVIKNKPRQWMFNIEDLPFPAYHLVDMNHYLELPKKGFYYRKKNTLRSVSLITSRGCPENCNFCVVFYVTGKPWRQLSAEHVFNHIKLLVQKYN